MSNNEITVIEPKKGSLSQMARSECENYLAFCVESAKEPAKRMVLAVIDQALNWVIDYVHNKFAA